jgi:hypothetical protein
MSFHVPEKQRIVNGALASRRTDGNNGAFVVHLKANLWAYCIASDGLGWEHVSVSLFKKTAARSIERCPTWEEMCFIKDTFWDEEDCILQFHPPRSEYVNNHPFVLHLWRPTTKKIAVPESILVGIKQEGINGGL